MRVTSKYKESGAFECFAFFVCGQSVFFEGFFNYF